MNGRDTFFNEVYAQAKSREDIVVVTADLSAPCFDLFRQDFFERFINVGIAEQNLISLGSGLALAGKKVIMYGLNPFPVTRAFDQVRNLMSGLRVPITLVVFNSGSSSATCGYTHMPLENFAMLRALQNIRVIIPSDNTIALCAAVATLAETCPTIIQFEKFVADTIYTKDQIDIPKGFCVSGTGKGVSIVANGYNAAMIYRMLPEFRKCGVSVKLIDCFSFPLNKELLVSEFETVESIITIEDNVLDGGLGSFVLELLSDFSLSRKVKRLGVSLNSSNHYIENRETIYGKCGLDKDGITNMVMQMAGRV
jgi:transketolase